MANSFDKYLEFKVDFGKWDFENFFNPTAFRWNYQTTPFSNFAVPVVISIFYLISIYVLTNWMRERKPMKLLWFSTLHNAFLVVLSVFMSVGSIIGAYETIQTKGFWQTIVCEKDSSNLSGFMWYWSYLFYLSKYYEMVDSWLLILRKKPTIFLHVYHHAVMPFVCWAGLEGRWTMALWNSTSFNSFVHVLMYSYFLMADYNYTPAWKRYLTQIQITQFVSGVMWTTLYSIAYFTNIRYDPSTLIGLTFDAGCEGELWAVVFMQCVNHSFLFLFVKWYFDNYKAPRDKSAKKTE